MEHAALRKRYKKRPFVPRSMALVDEIYKLTSQCWYNGIGILTTSNPNGIKWMLARIERLVEQAQEIEKDNF